MKVKWFMGVLIFAFIAPCAGAQEAAAGEIVNDTAAYTQLLESYKANDRQLKELAISYEQAELSYSKVLIQNGTSWNISSGSMNAKITGENTTLSVSPSASVTLPSLNNSQVKLSSPLGITLGGGTPAFSVNGAGVSIGTDIVSSADEKRSVTLVKAQRSLEEAQRRLDARKLAVEKEFLSALKSLYNAKLSVISKEDALISRQRDLDSLQAQGFEPSSARYRTALLSYQSALRDAEVQQRSFDKALLNFAHKCSLETISLDFILPESKLISMESFSKEDYKELESSTWTHYVNSLSRDAASPLTITAEAGYAFSYKELRGESEIGNTLSTGVALKYNGLNLSAGVQLPVENIKNPTVNVSLSWSPSEKKLASITDKENELNVQQEILSIESSLESYENTVSDKEKTREDLIWQMQKNIEQLAMYKDLADDMKSWYDKGVISLSDYKQAVTNYENALVQISITKIDQLLYDIEISSLFVNQKLEQEK